MTYGGAFSTKTRPITGVNAPSLPFNHSDYLCDVSEPDVLLLTHAGSHLPLDRQMSSNSSRGNVLLRDLYLFIYFSQMLFLKFFKYTNGQKLIILKIKCQIYWAGAISVKPLSHERANGSGKFWSTGNEWIREHRGSQIISITHSIMQEQHRLINILNYLKKKILYFDILWNIIMWCQS